MAARDSGAGVAGVDSATGGGWAGVCTVVAECSETGPAAGALSAAATASAGAARFLLLRGVGGSSKTFWEESETTQQKWKHSTGVLCL